MVEAFGDGGHQRREAFGDGFGVAGEVDDEGAAADAGGGAGEDGGGDFGEGDGAHDFAEAGHFFFDDSASSLGRDIARCGAGAAGGDDEGTAIGAQLAEGGFDAGTVVREEDALELDGFGKHLAQDAFDFRAAFVFVDAAAGAVAEGDASDFHFLILETRWMPWMTMVLSTALHMS